MDFIEEVNLNDLNFDLADAEAEVQKLTMDILDIERQLAQSKEWVDDGYFRTSKEWRAWRNKTVHALRHKQMRRMEIKPFIKAANIKTSNAEHDLYKDRNFSALNERVLWLEETVKLLLKPAVKTKKASK